VRILSTFNPQFEQAFSALCAWQSTSDDKVSAVVDDIIAAVRARGDAAVLEYSNRLDQRDLRTLSEAEVPLAACHQALAVLPAPMREALTVAADRIRSYHHRQLQDGWEYTDAGGTLLGQRITPLERVGVYVPGGKASYPSSVLMNVIPAKVAGVPEVIMVVPAPRGELNPLVLAAAAMAGVDRVFTLGGAQAVAALAYGTQTIPRVDKIVGPGNAYVATAKQRVFGQVGIDMVAGPSEILVICDGQTPADWIAMDLFSQAEHDEQAQALLLSPDRDFLEAVSASIARLLPQMARRDVIAASLEQRGALIHTRSLEEAADIANRVAPEHLELSVADPKLLLARIHHAGAVFLGRHTPEAIGDYCAGPSHVLPTAGTARFSSPLGVYDFQKRTSIIGCSAQSALALGQVAATLAHGESLEAHARSVELRMPNSGDGSEPFS